MYLILEFCVYYLQDVIIEKYLKYNLMDIVTLVTCKNSRKLYIYLYD